MSARLRSIGRVVEVQRELRRAAERRRIQAERTLAELEERRRDLVRFLSDEHAFAGLFASSLAVRLRTLSSEIEDARRVVAAEAAIVLREAGRAKRAERIMEAVAEEARRHAERRELLSIVEEAVRRADASPP